MELKTTNKGTMVVKAPKSSTAKKPQELRDRGNKGK